MHFVSSKLLKFYSYPTRWTQKAFARDKNNNPISPLDKNAVCFCIDGAIAKLQNDCDINQTEIDEFDTLFQAKLGTITKYNDTHTFEEIINELQEI